MTAEQIRRVALLIETLNQMARENHVYLSTLNPYVELEDGRIAGQLEWCQEEMQYKLIELSR